MGWTGFEYHLVHAFARDLGVRLELAIPPPGIDAAEWLEQGYGDVLALHEPAGWGDAGRFRVSEPYRNTDLVSVLSVKTQLPAAVEDLAGIPVAASIAVASLLRLIPLSPAIDATTPGPGFDALAALREVSRGRIGVAVVDRDTAQLELTHLADLRLGPVVLPDQPLVWLFNPMSAELASRADDFLSRARSSGTVRQLAAAQLGSWSPPVPADLPAVPDGAITPYDELLRFEGQRRGVDWRLLASLMYEESRFDPEAVGPGGSAGLFQFMPLTWRDLGVEDPHHPGEAVEAGGWYLEWLMDQFADLELSDQVAMAIASYNVGPRHVFDARRLARRHGLRSGPMGGQRRDRDAAARRPGGRARFSRQASAGAGVRLATPAASCAATAPTPSSSPLSERSLAPILSSPSILRRPDGTQLPPLVALSLAGGESRWTKRRRMSYM